MERKASETLVPIKALRALLYGFIILMGVHVLQIAFSADAQPFVSSELRFTDSSRAGAHIVPASCPSSPHAGEDCSVPSAPSQTGCVLVSEPPSFNLAGEPEALAYRTPNSTYSLTIPEYTGNFIVELWGAGGGGGGDGTGDTDGGDGGNSFFGNDTIEFLVAGGGGGGREGATTSGGGTGGIGGFATEGDVNTPGNIGGNAFAGSSQSGAGGSSPYGGMGGASVIASNGEEGAVPGGGGSGGAVSGENTTYGGGGGGGGYVKKTYTTSTLPPGTVVNIRVGAPGATGGGQAIGGIGRRGEVRVSWLARPRVNLGWNSTNLTNLSLSPGIGSVAESGVMTVYPTTMTTYTLTGQSQSGQMTCDTVIDNDTALCTAQYFCSGSDLTFRNNQCVDSLVSTCPQGCLNGACIGAPPPDGSLSAQPRLVQRGEASVITWSASDVTSCTVSGTNGDSWTGTSGSQTTSPIQNQTIYTLSCTGPGGILTDTEIINIIPVFQET